MSVLSVLKITPSELQKVNSELYEAYIKLQDIKKLIDTGIGDDTMIRVYNSTSKEIERYLFSDDFANEAKSKGVAIRSSEESKKIESIEEPEDVNMDILEEILAEIEAPLEEEAVEAADVSAEVDSDDDLDSILKDIESIDVSEDEAEEAKEEVAEEAEEESFIYEYHVGKQSTAILVQNISKLIAYGSLDSKLNYYESASAFNYLIELPRALGRIIVSYSAAIQEAKDSRDLSALMQVIKESEKFDEGDIKIYLSAEDKESLIVLSNILTSRYSSSSFSYSTISGVKAVGQVSLKSDGSDIFDEVNYEEVNGLFDKWDTSSSFADMQGRITHGWRTIKAMIDGEETESEIIHSAISGLGVQDYLYVPVEYLFGKGGKYVQTQSQVYYVPKQNKALQVYDMGRHFKDNGVESSKYERDAGKISKSEFSNPSPANIVASYKFDPSESESFKDYGETALVGEEGRVVYASTIALNYFKKYYGQTIQFALTEKFVQINEGDTMVGFVPVLRDGNIVEGFNVALTQLEVQQKAREILPSTFDYMTPITDLIGIEFLGLEADKEEPTDVPTPSTEEIEEQIEIDDSAKEEAEEILAEIESTQQLIEIFKDSPEERELLELELPTMKMLYEALTGTKIGKDEE